MPTAVSPEIRCKTESEVRNLAVDFSGRLDSGELLTDTPTAVDGSNTITTSSVAVSTTVLTINGITVAVGKAVQFAVDDAGSAGTTYTFKVTVPTDSTPVQTLIANVRLLVIADA